MQMNIARLENNIKYKHIQKFPSDVNNYDFLNACDVLITDYSSVFFDYANTRNKIVLFTYDIWNFLIAILRLRAFLILRKLLKSFGGGDGYASAFLYGYVRRYIRCLP